MNGTEHEQNMNKMEQNMNRKTFTLIELLVVTY